jgi:hypothetical protein
LQDVLLPTEHRPTADYGFLPFVSPPFVAWALSPLAGLSLPIFYVVIGVANWGFLFVLLGAVYRLMSGWGETWRSATLMFCLAWVPIVWTLLQGQVSIFLAMALALGYLGLSRRRDVLAGLVLALLWTKPQYAILIFPALLAWRRWAAATSFALTSGVLLLISLAVVGPEGFRDYVALLARIETMGPSYAMFPASYHTLGGLLRRFLGLHGTPWLLLVCLLIAGVLLRLATWGVQPRSYALLVLTTVLVSPHTHIQDLAVLVPAIVLGGAALRKDHRRLLVWCGTWLLVLFGFYLLAQTPRFLQDSPLFTVTAMAMSALMLLVGLERGTLPSSPEGPARTPVVMQRG